MTKTESGPNLGAEVIPGAPERKCFVLREVETPFDMILKDDILRLEPANEEDKANINPKQYWRAKGDVTQGAVECRRIIILEDISDELHFPRNEFYEAVNSQEERGVQS